VRSTGAKPDYPEQEVPALSKTSADEAHSEAKTSRISSTKEGERIDGSMHGKAKEAKETESLYKGAEVNSNSTYIEVFHTESGEVLSFYPTGEESEGSYYRLMRQSLSPSDAKEPKSNLTAIVPKYGTKRAYNLVTTLRSDHIHRTDARSLLSEKKQGQLYAWSICTKEGIFSQYLISSRLLIPMGIMPF